MTLAQSSVTFLAPEGRVGVALGRLRIAFHSLLIRIRFSLVRIRFSSVRSGSPRSDSAHSRDDSAAQVIERVEQIDANTALMDVGQDRLAASEWMPRRVVCESRHGGIA